MPATRPGRSSHACYQLADPRDVASPLQRAQLFCRALRSYLQHQIYSAGACRGSPPARPRRRLHCISPSGTRRIRSTRVLSDHACKSQRPQLIASRSPLSCRQQPGTTLERRSRGGRSLLETRQDGSGSCEAQAQAQARMGAKEQSDATSCAAQRTMDRLYSLAESDRQRTTTDREQG
ncbi:uncharacterized protein BDV17DRAFT_263593 [Aspergillus undulatus]|uniref:uncharacterized protein n=1 Tax=Aspergillus undulatus TaxID=1810928 RepID=UPI003CCD94D3